MKRIYALALSLVMVLGLLAGCGAGETGKPASADLGAVAGDYYLDLSELGMKLTIYLRIAEDGGFRFANTTDFSLVKSSGTVQKGEDKYMMVYDSVNGEDKNLSEGLTSSFQVREDGSLDFSSCERIYYGSASAVTVSDNDPGIILLGVPLPEGYQEASTESVFQPGVYAAEGENISLRASFYDDNSYLLTQARTEGGSVVYSSESGVYGVSTTQLALTPTGASRLSGEVLSETELMLPVLQGGERIATGFTLVEQPGEEMTFTGRTEDGLEVSLTLTAEGVFTSEANGFRESGILVLDSETGSFKIYPDHPQTGLRGLNQIGTVPAGSFTLEDGRLTLQDLRIRTNEGLSRTKCTLTQN